MGIGLWAIGGQWNFTGGPAGWGDVDDEESIRAIHAALDHGVNFFDTAANYGCGHSERILAKALEGQRHRAVIATKFGYRIDEVSKNVTELDDVAGSLRADCEASLRRLNIEVIDLYQFHVNEYDPTKAAPVRDELEKLVEAGKIRFYGWSTDFPEGASVFAEGKHGVAIQANMNVIHTNPAILAVCEQFDMACVNRGPLGMGLLTGKYTHDSKWVADDVRNAEWVQKGFVGPILDSLPRIREVLTSGGRTLAQGALAWLWAHSPRTIPIPGARTVTQVEENAGAMRYGPLSPEQMQEIERLLGR
jgi:aryl-alcohol dehydrogenase-like predicted oxidoreductase